MYVRIINGQVAKYPFYLHELAAEGVCLPSNPTQAQREAEGVLDVWLVAKPTTPGYVYSEANPELVNGVWTQVWRATAMSVGDMAAALDADKKTLILKIDADVDAINAAVIGNRAQEYVLAESEAQAFAAAGYNGAAPGSVQSWATAKGQSTTWAANDILTTAAAWRGAQAAIRAARLLRKEQARNAASFADLDVVKVQWSGFVSYIRAQLGLA